jgi:hypothetical protein
MQFLIRQLLREVFKLGFVFSSEKVTIQIVGCLASMHGSDSVLWDDPRFDSIG